MGFKGIVYKLPFVIRDSIVTIQDRPYGGNLMDSRTIIVKRPLLSYSTIPFLLVDYLHRSCARVALVI